MSNLSQDDLDRLDAYWRAANHLTVGRLTCKRTPDSGAATIRADQAPTAGSLGHQIRPRFALRPPQPPHPRHRGHILYITSPGHSAPAILANVYLEGTHIEIYPAVTQNEAGVRLLFRRFSTPDDVPSHFCADTPGLIHEGSEGGHSRVHTFGAAFDNPDLLVACVAGNGEAEIGSLVGS